MKRFYCTICRKVKRVRNLPVNTVTPDSDNVYQRTGECNRHSAMPVMQKYAKAHDVEPVELNMLNTSRKTKRRA